MAIRLSQSTARSAGGGRKRRRQGRTGGSRRGEATQEGALMDDNGDEMTRLRSQDEQVYKSARSAFMLR